MKRFQRLISSLRASTRIGLCAVTLFVSLLAVSGAPPAWWSERGVVNGQPADDYAVANLGQLKHVASKAAAELNAHLPGGAGAEIDNLVASWRAAPAAGVTRDDFAAVNLGQLKAVAKRFYDRLISVHYLEAYPWANGQPDDYASANLGQLKYLFSFDLTRDSDGDGLPDWWELAAGLDPNDPGDASLLTGNPENVSGSGQHLSNTGAYQTGLNPAATRNPLKPEIGKGKPLLELPTTTYAAIDVSSQTTTQNIWFVAIDDHSNLAFGYAAEDYNSFKTAVFGNGTVGQKKSFPFTEWRSVQERWEPVPGLVWHYSYNFNVEHRFSSLAATGEPGGANFYRLPTAGFIRAFRYSGTAEKEYWPDMDESDPSFYELGAFVFNGVQSNGGSSLIPDMSVNLGNAGLLAGQSYVNYTTQGFTAQGSTSIWYGSDHTSLHTTTAAYVPETFSPNGTNAGLYASSPGNFYAPTNFAVCTGTEPTSIGHLLPLAVSDNGTVLGDDADAIDSHNSLSIRLAGFTELLSHKLPDKYHGRIRFPGDNLGSWINNQSDIIVNAELLDDTDSVNPIWASRQLLWRNALGLGTDPSTLSFVQFPANATPKQCNNQGNFAARIAIPDATNQTIGYRFAAGLLLPVESVSVNDAGDPTDDAMMFAPSYPSPVVDVADVSVSGVTKGQDGILRGTVTLKGTVSSAVCDTLPSAQGGTIDQAQVYVNGAASAQATINLQVTKETGSHAGKPFPYHGSFTTTLENVPLTAGKNVFKVCASDKIYCIPGFDSWEVNIKPNYSSASDATPTTQGVSLNLPPNASAFAQVNQLTINYAVPDGTIIPITVTRSTSGENDFVSSDGGVTIRLLNASQLSPNHRLTITLEITAPAYGLDHRLFHLSQGGIGSSAFAGAVASIPANAAEPPSSVSGDDPPLPEPQSYYTEEKYSLEQSNGGEFHPGMIRVRAPAGLSENLRVRLGQNALTYSFIAGVKPGEYFLKRRDCDAAMVVAIRCRTASANPDDAALLETLKALGRDLPKGFLEFQWGFLTGIAAGGWDMVSGLADVVGGTMAYAARLEVMPVLDAYIFVAEELGGNPNTAMKFRFRLETQQRAANEQILAVARTLPPLVWTLVKLHQEEALMAIDWMSGRTLLAQHSQLHRKLLSWTGDLLAAEWKTIEKAEPKEQGYLMGRAVFEILSLLVPEAEAGKLAELSKLEFLTKFFAESKFFQPGGKGATAAAKIRRDGGLMKRLEALGTGCFAAGTPVWTRNGWIAIEAIRPGDLVLARDPRTYAQGWHPVLSTTVTHPGMLVHIRYAALSKNARGGDPADDASPEEEVICTPEHPLWVWADGGGSFLKADRLRPGVLLELADGRSAEVRSTAHEQASSGRLFTAYNFAVASAHTYFVGNSGVWVHNACTVHEVESLIFELEQARGLNDLAAKRARFQHLKEAVAKLFMEETDLQELSRIAKKNSEILLKDFAELLANEHDPTKIAAILADFPVYEGATNGWRGGYFLTKEQVETQIHHIIPESVLERLKEIDSARFPEGLSPKQLPAHAWDTATHQAYHNPTNGVLGMNGTLLSESSLQGFEQSSDLARALINYYRSPAHPQPEMADIAAAWFKVHGIVP